MSCQSCLIVVNYSHVLNSTFPHVECEELRSTTVAPHDTDLKSELTIIPTKAVTEASHVKLKATTQYVLALKAV